MRKKLLNVLVLGLIVFAGCGEKEDADTKPSAGGQAVKEVSTVDNTGPEQKQAEVVEVWEFESKEGMSVAAQDCDIRVEDGFFKVGVQQGDPQIDFGQVDIEGPVKIRMRMKSGEGAFGRVEWYFKNAGQEYYEEDKCGRFAVVHDGKWREYEMPLSSTKDVRGLRMDPGWQPGEFVIDWIRFERIELPAEVKKAMAEQGRKIAVENEALRLELDTAGHVYTIRQKATGKVYTSDCGGSQVYFMGVEDEQQSGFTVRLWDHAEEVEYSCRVELEKEGAVVSFGLDSEQKQQRFFGPATYPAGFVSDYEDGKLVFCNRSSGLYVEQDDDYEAFRQMLVYGNLSLDMPWVGVVEPGTGYGYMLLVETPYDAFVKLEKDAEGVQWPGIRWWESMDTFRYARKMSYRFSDGGGYVNLARMYRKYSQQQGLAVTLAEKEADKPQVSFLKGAPVIWGSMDAWEFVREARTAGIVRGVMSNCHHALSDIDSIVKMNELGYVTNEYGNFSDILPGDEPGFFKDDIEDATYHRRPGAGPAKGWYAADTGLQYYSRSTATAMRAVKSYVPQRMEKYKFNGRFIDVSNAIDLFEDYHPEHTFDRRQDLEYRREVYEFVNDFGVVLGTEHGNDWIMDMADYFEGALSGPFWWVSVGKWNPGILQKAEKREDISEVYLKYGMAHERRIPLWQLVYHDCAVSTWYWGDVPGFLYSAAPELAARKDLFAILYGSVPLFWRDHIGYDWNENRSRFLRSYHETCKLHEEIAYDKMLSHEFLSDDRAVQRTRFDSGTVAVVNFGDRAAEYDTGDGGKVMLAPFGFWVKGQKISQSRLIVGGKPVTRIEKDGYLRVEAEEKRDFGAVELEGLLTAFEIERGRWHLVVENCDEVKLDVFELTGTGPGEIFEIFRMDKKGVLLGKAGYEPEQGGVVLRPGSDYELYALTTVVPDEVKVLPDTDVIMNDDLIELYTEKEGAEVYYTLDGSEPVPGSLKYSGPFGLDKSAVVKARAFDADGRAVSKTGERDYRVRKLLFDSGVMTVEKGVIAVDVGVKEGESLVLEVDDANTAVFWDYADWARAHIVNKDGSEVYLSDMEPVYLRMDHAVLGRDQRTRQQDNDEKEAKPLMMGGRVYEKGLGMMSESLAVYELDGAAMRFKCVAGLDDTAGEKGRVIMRVYVNMPYE